MSLFGRAGPRSRRLRSFLRRRAAAPPVRRPLLDAESFEALFRKRAVVFTDCANFTVRTLRDGILHFLMVFEAAVDGAGAAVRRTGGSVLKIEADSLLLVYDDATAACRGVDAIERFLAGFNAGRPADEQARFSYGIGYGDLLDLDGDTFGLEVNLASKMGEDLARPGEILLTPGAVENLAPSWRRRLVPHAPCRLHGQAIPVKRLRRRRA
jgi:class 3 adenylate cyclase